MNENFQQHRLARIEGYQITLAQLEARFRNGIGSFVSFEESIAALLDGASACIPAWRHSETEQVGYRDGVCLAALEFYWQHREQVRIAIEHDVRGQEFATETKSSLHHAGSFRCLRHRSCK